MPSNNSENPYVLNENYYENTTHVIYKNTTFYVIFRASFILFFLLSLLSIGLVVFLVIFKTPKAFKPYSKMLFICNMVDVYFSLEQFLLQPRLFIKNHIEMFSLIGPFSYLSYQTQCYSLGWFSSSTVLASTSIPVQYYIRYRIIKYNKIPSVQRLIFYFFIATAFACPSFYLMPNAVCSFENVNQTDFSRYWHPEFPVPKLFVGVQNHPPYITHFAYLFVVQFTSYILSIILARKTLSELKGKFLSPKTRALQGQFSRTLLAQSICPLITVILPPIISICTPLIGLNIDNIGDICIMIFTFSPVLNNLATIILIVPYRNYCIGLLCFWKKRLVGSSNTAVIPIPSTVNRT